jgi:hypothetical protein
MSNNESQTEIIFLVYANLLFKDDPNNLKSISAAIKDFEMYNLDRIGFNYERQKEIAYPAENPNILSGDLDPIVDEIIRLSDLGEHHAMMENDAQRHGQAIKFIPQNWHNIAYAAAYRHNDIDPDGKAVTCESCLYYEGRRGLSFMSEPRKCFECDQMAFIRMLDQLIEGRELDELPEFRDYLQARNRAAINIVDFDISKDDSFKKSLRRYVSFDTLKHFGKNDFDHNQYAFSSFLMIFVGYSLTEFLINNDRRKLKKCPYCDQYFIANNIRRKKCYSDDCKRIDQRLKKRKQRKDEPEIYL